MLSQLRIGAAGTSSVVGTYVQRTPSIIPDGFRLVCENMRWDTQKMWLTLADQQKPWFEAENGAYVYFNVNDRQWWIDEPDARG